jgi:hypothetical protein
MKFIRPASFGLRPAHRGGAGRSVQGVYFFAFELFALVVWAAAASFDDFLTCFVTLAGATVVVAATAGAAMTLNAMADAMRRFMI